MSLRGWMLDGKCWKVTCGMERGGPCSTMLKWTASTILNHITISTGVRVPRGPPHSSLHSSTAVISTPNLICTSLREEQRNLLQHVVFYDPVSATWGVSITAMLVANTGISPSVSLPTGWHVDQVRFTVVAMPFDPTCAD